MLCVNYIFIFLALLVAAGSVGFVYKFYVLTKKEFSWPDLVKVLVIGFGITVGSSVVAVVLGADGFGIVHLLYIVITVAVPISALALLLIIKTNIRIKAVLALLILLAPIGLYATYVEPFWLKVDEHSLDVQGFEDNIKIGVLADLQTTSIGKYEIDSINRLLSENPDIVLIPGDFWQMSDEEFNQKSGQFKEVMELLAGQTDHVFVVKGNTDTIAGLELITADTGVQVLDNEIAEIEVKGSAVFVGGITLFGDDSQRPKVINKLLEEDSSSITILLGHKPDEVYLLPEDKTVDLVVAGHTHGGQVNFPLFGPPLTLTSVPRDVAAGGLSILDGQNIYVSTGVGRERHQAPQMRFGVRPSIGIINVS